MNCIVFDFDCTLTRKHAYYYYNDPKKFSEIYSEDPPNLTNNIDQTLDYFFGISRLQNLRNFLEKISAVAHIYVASRGYYNNIKYLLDISHLDQYFKFIHCINSRYYKNKKTSNKKEFIKLLLEEYQNVYYLDDDQEEHQRLVQQHNWNLIKDTLEYFCYLVPPNNHHYYFFKKIIKNGYGIGIPELDLLGKLILSNYDNLNRSLY
jgi:hypothetical protein